MTKYKLKFGLIYILFIPNLAFPFLGTAVSFLDDIYRASYYSTKLTRTQFAEQALINPSLIKTLSMSKNEKVKLYIGIAVEKDIIKSSQQLHYIDKFNKLDGGDNLLINAIKENKSLDDVLNYSSQIVKQTQGEKIKNSVKLYSDVVASKTKNTVTQSKTYLGDKALTTKFEVKGVVNNAKTHSFLDANGNTISAKIRDIIDLKRTIKMPYLGSAVKNTNAAGFLRDYKKFAQEYAKLYPETLSRNNLERIKNGLSPIVDKQWIRFNPNHKTFKGENLQHHHINNTNAAGYLPTSLHIGKVNKDLVHVH